MREDDYEDAEQRVAGPAIGLIVTAALSGALLLLALIFDVWLLASGAAGQMPQPRGMPKESQLTVRIVWGVLMLATDAVILAGAVGMKGLRGYGLSKLACGLALVPCLGPCFVLGLPFGIWGWAVLGDRRVRRAFAT
jgi:hypothetical protein